jgi:hypothetical protein
VAAIEDDIRVANHELDRDVFKTLKENPFFTDPIPSE